MNCSKTFAAGAMALMLACSATAARGQTAPSVVESTVSTTQSDDSMDQDLAQQISQASSEGKDVSNSGSLRRINGKIALVQRCFPFVHPYIFFRAVIFSRLWSVDAFRPPASIACCFKTWSKRGSYQNQG